MSARKAAKRRTKAKHPATGPVPISPVVPEPEAMCNECGRSLWADKPPSSASVADVKGCLARAKDRLAEALVHAHERAHNEDQIQALLQLNAEIYYALGEINGWHQRAGKS